MRICDAVYPDPVSMVRPSDAALLPAGQCGSYIVPGDPSSFSRSEPVQDPAQGRGVRTASPAGTRRERERGGGEGRGGRERESSCENVERPAPLSSYECCVLCVCVCVCVPSLCILTHCTMLPPFSSSSLISSPLSTPPAGPHLPQWQLQLF